MIVCTFHAACPGKCAAATGPRDELRRGHGISGSIACGSIQCGSGELCVLTEVDGSDGSAHPIDEYSCGKPASGCPLAACSGACAYQRSIMCFGF